MKEAKLALEQILQGNMKGVSGIQAEVHTVGQTLIPKAYPFGESCPWCHPLAKVTQDTQGNCARRHSMRLRLPCTIQRNRQIPGISTANPWQPKQNGHNHLSNRTLSKELNPTRRAIQQGQNLTSITLGTQRATPSQRTQTIKTRES